MIHLLIAALAAFCVVDDPPNGPDPIEVRPTSVVKGPIKSPKVLVRLTLNRPLADPGVVRVMTPADGLVYEGRPERNLPGETLTAPVPFKPEVDLITINISTEEGEDIRYRTADVPRPAPWVLHFIPGFHYDPVWWNTQANYTETGNRLDRHVGPGLALIDEYLRMCREDADYKFSLHQLPYLKTFLEAKPEHRAELLDRIHDGRCDLIGGTYNEFSSTLIGSESAIRNAVFGRLLEHDVLNSGGDVFWQCDVFGHDPSFASIMLGTGHTAGAFGRGPFHQWGAPRDQVNFPSEFMWMSPDGREILTHYMTGHYGYAYGRLASGGNRAPDDAKRCDDLIIDMFEDLKRPALTHHIMLPMVEDFIRPMENLGDLARHWNKTYLTPDVEISTPDAFFAAVRTEIEQRKLVVPVITRDMNPIYTGCGVSFVDLKLAERACESMLRDAERFATLAALAGAPYPAIGLNRAWRQLAFNAHHDGVTGSMSDQVFIDLMYAYRDALDIATKVRARSLEYLSRPSSNGGVEMQPPVGEPEHDDHAAADLPSRDLSITEGDGGQSIVMENDSLRAVISLAKGGAIVSLFDKIASREWLRGPGNDVVTCDEYDTLPGHGEGPWHLAPTGRRHPGTGVSARRMDAAEPGEIVVEADYPDFTKRQTISLRSDPPRLDCRTEILRWRGRNALLRVEFPVDAPGARPVWETAAAVIARPFGRDVDAAKDPWTLDETAWQWFGLGTCCALTLKEGDEVVHRRALGVGEIVVGAGASAEVLRAANECAAAFVQCGVTTTITRSDARRYGDLKYDSNEPDFRVLVGDTQDNPLVAEAIGKGASSTSQPHETRWIERKDRLPVLIVAAEESPALCRELRETQQILLPRAQSRINSLAVTRDEGFGIVNRGTVSGHVSADGTVSLNLMRSCTSWPSGVWIDEPTRRHPDGSALELMHGSHVFEYSVVPHRGDFRHANLCGIADRLNHPSPARDASGTAAGHPNSLSQVDVEPPGVLLTALKPAGYPVAGWSLDALPDPSNPIHAVAARLWNGTGRRVTARVRLPHSAGTASRTDLLEHHEADLPVSDGWFSVDMAPNEIATVIAEVRSRSRDSAAPSLDPTEGDTSPSEYWLENRGEGNSTNGVLAISPRPRYVSLSDGAAEVELRIVNNDASHSFDVDLTLIAPPGLTVNVQPAALSVAPRSFSTAVLHVQANEDAPKGASLITIATTFPGGRQVTGSIWIDPPDDAPATAPVEIENAASIAADGHELRAVIHNRTDGPIAGEAAWLSPTVLWPATPDWRQQVNIPARGSAEVSCPLVTPADSYALLRFTCGGRVAYGPTIATASDKASWIMSASAHRLRLAGTAPAEVAITCRSVGGSLEDFAVSVECEKDIEVREVGRTASQRTGESEQVIRYEVVSRGAGTQSTLRFVGPGGAVSTVDVRAIPELTARPLAKDARIDGQLTEWSHDEFAKAIGESGWIRGAARYGTRSLVLAFEVEDDAWSQPYTGSDIWRGDSVQFALTPKPTTESGYPGNVCEFGVAATVEGPVVWCWYNGVANLTGPVEGAKAVVTLEGNRRRYEVRIPRAAIPQLDLDPDRVLGFTFAANDNDGQGHRGAIAWTGGISGSKDASLFGNLRLLAK